MTEVYEYYGESLRPELCTNGRDHIGAFIKKCHEEQYDSVRYFFVAMGFVLFIFHLVNFIALIEHTGISKLNANQRIQNHWHSSLTSVIGAFGFGLGSLNPWGIEMGSVRHLGYIFGTVAVVCCTQILIMQFFFWYTISLALAASVTLKPVGKMDHVKWVKWALVTLMVVLWVVYLTFSILLCIHFGLENEQSRTIVTSVQTWRFHIFFANLAIQLSVTVLLGVRIYMYFRELNRHVTEMTRELNSDRSDHFRKARSAGQRIVISAVLLTILQAALLVVVGFISFEPLDKDKVVTWGSIWPRLVFIWLAIGLFYIWFLIMFRYDRDMDERNKWLGRVYNAVFGQFTEAANEETRGDDVNPAFQSLGANGHETTDGTTANGLNSETNDKSLKKVVVEDPVDGLQPCQNAGDEEPRLAEGEAVTNGAPMGTIAGDRRRNAQSGSAMPN